MKEKNLIWYPAETDVSIRPGWFYHPEEDNKVRSFENLKDIYLKAVGGNTTLLLNLPPMKNGKLHETDVKNLKELGAFIRQMHKVNLMDFAEIETIPAIDIQGNSGEVLRKEDYASYFLNKENDTRLLIKLRWEEKRNLKYLVLKEAIPLSQRVENFLVCYENLQGNMKECYKGTTIGYKKIIELNNINTNCLTIEITDSRVAPALAFIGVY